MTKNKNYYIQTNTLIEVNVWICLLITLTNKK